MSAQQTPSPTKSNVSSLSLSETPYKQNIEDIEDDIIVETTVLSLAHAIEIEKHLINQPATIAGPLTTYIHIACTTQHLELENAKITDDVTRLSCNHLQWLWNTTEVGRLPAPTPITAPAVLPISAPVGEAPSQPLPIPPPTEVYQRKTWRGATIHGIMKTKSSKGKKHQIVDLTINEPALSFLAHTAPTITVKMPSQSRTIGTTTDSNFVCQLCKELSHKHKNCPMYYCRVCNTQKPGHFSIYCPYAPKADFLLVYTDEGFYKALAKWEAQKDHELEVEIEHTNREYLVQPEDNLTFHNADADPIYYANQDE
ncbi:uncharacterized protein F5147DRAFT_773479 [Suillus discolor]|uniref:CCHC-type domain-containing protein n=1 Tax=Suillus discolor TaxID=1912936 RepID=A0A9P7JTX6_9AGAM|nr:uncharacterized protein F5147DRAFT_773479 [Suillus discolor]KAG2108678.1 hypothetical protein F5147DRAFT_773479 [Suillus discolor]